MIKSVLPVDIYVRVSRVGSREHLTSPQDQEREARAFARSHGLVIGEVITDLDHSGGTLDRPGLQEALRRVEGRESGGVLVSYLSRASRDTAQGLTLLDRITAAGGAVFAPNLPDYTTADGRMLTTIQLAVDTGYRERKREEFESAKRGAIERGIPIHSRPPVGYRARPDRRLEPDPRTAPIVREVFEQRAQGDGPAALGKLLQDNRVKTSQGSKTWTSAAIYNLLQNRVYLGELSYGLDRRYVNATAHEPIVDLATWQAAQSPKAQLAAPRSPSSAWLMAGIARCRGCGYSLQGTVSGSNSKQRIYRCTRKHAGGVCQEPARIDAGTLEAAAIESFWTLIDDLEAQGSRDDERWRIATLEDMLAKAEARLVQYLDPAVQDAAGDTAEYATGLRARRSARDSAAETLGKAKAEASYDGETPSPRTLRADWMSRTTVERRELLGRYFDLVAVGRDRTVDVFVRGTGPTDLPTRGYRSEPRLCPIVDVPADARILAA